jgi:hypothetical protein
MYIHIHIYIYTTFIIIKLQRCNVKMFKVPGRIFQFTLCMLHVLYITIIRYPRYELHEICYRYFPQLFILKTFDQSYLLQITHAPYTGALFYLTIITCHFLPLLHH